MVQYIINASIIWLSCLLVYELLFRNVSFHKFNRTFLLITLIAGASLPLVNINALMPDTGIVLPEPVRQVKEAKQAIVLNPLAQQHAPTSLPYDISQIAWLIYILGVVVSSILILREVLLLSFLYIKGRKTTEHGFKIVETGKQHGPFSFFNIIFVRSRSEYKPAQWRLLTMHEQEHSRRLHTLDNLLVLSFHILFWFHPLVHVYYIRLRMVHEFQADRAVAANLHDYGKFLLEQTMLQRAPVLTHSLDSSPVKARISMLNKTANRKVTLLKYLVVVPLSFALALFCTKHSFSGPANSGEQKVIFKGNEIVFGALKVIPYHYMETVKLQRSMFMPVTVSDSFHVRNNATGKYEMQAVVKDIMPVAINGKPILGNEPQYLLPGEYINYTPPVFNGSALSLDEYLFSELKGELDKLEDGVYRLNINRLLVDDEGKLAYYENKGIEISMGDFETKPVMDEQTMNEINRKLDGLLEGPVTYKPAVKEGKAVNVRLGFGNYYIVVKQHKAQLAERKGC